VIPTQKALEDRFVLSTLPVAHPDSFTVYNSETLYRSDWGNTLQMWHVQIPLGSNNPE
jgi:hypothetical protein